MNEGGQSGQLRQLFDESIGENLYQIILSNSREKEKAERIRIRPVLLKDCFKFQVSRYAGDKVFHENLEGQALKELLAESLQSTFRQAQITCKEFRATVLVSRKGKITIQKKRQDVEVKRPELAHNKTKRYILPEGEPVAFLVDLGVMTPEGRIVRARYDKYRQINRYLEFIEDILPTLPKDRTIHIIDFGCGKSYLTFALYYYLKELKHYDIQITGLDLKEDVIETCNALRNAYGYQGLRFVRGDIASYEGQDEVDMVVTLHACDTATDYAIEKAVKWHAKVIFCVPCCQHEVNRQISNETLEPLLRYGLLKERMSALITDGVRAGLLEQMGYETQVLEFIDMEHTPKNILIRAILKRKPGGRDASLERLMEQLHINPALKRLLYEEK